jgi:hypothetical protein
MIEIVKVDVMRCTCEAIDKTGNVCAHKWDSLAKKEPTYCPQCGSRSWNGIRKAGRPPGLRKTEMLPLPKPKRVRKI